MSYRHDDGTLILAPWGVRTALDSDPLRGVYEAEGVAVDGRERPVPMYGTKATGQPMVSNGHLGVDLIRVPAGEGFAPHTHPGDHLLIAIRGEGTVTVDGRIYQTRAGQVYMVEGAVPHAVGAITDHVLLAVGAPHRPIDAADRMTLTDYDAVAATISGDVTCLVCNGQPTGTLDQLRAAGCPHAPAEAPTTRPLIVGRAPATPHHEGRPAFYEAEAGDRLAALLDVAPARLLEVVDTVNLSPTYLADWSAMPGWEWSALATERVIPVMPGRVVVACGETIAGLLGASRYTIGAATIAHRALLVSIPHPRNTEGDHRHWRDHILRTTIALDLARNLARTGPAAGAWSQRDADAFNEAAGRMFAEATPRDR